MCTCGCGHRSEDNSRNSTVSFHLRGPEYLKVIRHGSRYFTGWAISGHLSRPSLITGDLMATTLSHTDTEQV